MKTYDYSEVALIIGGHIVEGGSEDSFVTFDRDDDAYTYHGDNNGGGTRAKNPSKAGKVTVRLQKSSPSNAFFSGLIKKDEIDNSGIVPVLCKDNSGFDLHKAESAYCVKWPSAEYTKDLPEFEYVFQCENLDMFLGGN